MLFIDIEKSIGDFTLKVNFETDESHLSLLGTSGSGKSMTLKCIAGIEKPDAGIIILNDCVLFDSEKGINLPPQKRKVGYLFQQYALFPNMSVRENIEVALHHLPKEKRKAVINEKLRDFKIDHIQNKKPYELSGGEKQRVALARIMANNPDVLLLDEPFSSMDNYLKWQLLVEMKSTLANFKKDVVFVTHSIDEVFGLSDRICVLRDGISEPVTNIEEALLNPRTVSTAKLFGCNNFSKVELIEDVATCIDWNIPLSIDVTPIVSGKDMFVGVFSQDVELKSNDVEGDNLIGCTVSQVIKTGNSENIVLHINSTDNYLCASLQGETKFSIDEPVKAYISGEKLLFLEGSFTSPEGSDFTS